MTNPDFELAFYKATTLIMVSPSWLHNSMQALKAEEPKRDVAELEERYKASPSPELKAEIIAIYHQLIEKACRQHSKTFAALGMEHGVPVTIPGELDWGESDPVYPNYLQALKTFNKEVGHTS